MTDHPVPVDEQSMRILTNEFAQQILQQVAPEELVLYNATADEYFTDPHAVLNPKGRDEALGFGLELLMLTPVVISVAQTVLQWLASAAVEAAIKESTPSVMSYVRRLFGGADENSVAQPASRLTPEQAKHVREIAYNQAVTIGLEPEKAALIADSTAGVLVTAG